MRTSDSRAIVNENRVFLYYNGNRATLQQRISVDRQNVRFRKRIALLVIGSCFTLATILNALSLAQLATEKQRDIAELRRALYNSYDILLKTQIQAVMSVMKTHHDQVLNQELTMQEAQDHVKNILRDWRYMDNRSGYLWADTREGVNLIHPLQPEFEGKSRIDLKDMSGNLLIRNIINEGLKPDGGFVEYLWSNAPSEPVRLKRAYSLEFRPWGWIVGTGSYIDDIDATIRSNEEALRQSITSSIIKHMIAATFFSLILLWIARISVLKEIRQLGGDPERDMLTGSLSRMKLMHLAQERRRKLLSEQKSLSVALMDIDHFKQINDTYGHHVGDSALQHIANLCHGALRSADYFGRYGGEEFLFIFSGAGADTAAKLADRVRKLIEDSPLCLEDERSIRITVSVGVATLGSHSEREPETMESLIYRADKALYRAKKSGRNKVIAAE